jgi:hypothetical protein
MRLRLPWLLVTAVSRLEPVVSKVLMERICRSYISVSVHPDLGGRVCVCVCMFVHKHLSKPNRDGEIGFPI